MKIQSITSLLALLAVVAFGAFAQAQEMEESTQCEGECPIAAAMGDLPKMTYKVGEESVCCANAAAELAEKTGESINYVVGEESYTEKEAAMTSLVETTEAFVTEFVTPCKCDVSGVTKIAGKSCNCPIDAGKKAELVSTAVSGISMSYVVGEETCNCPNKAAALAQTSGEKQFYVVGEEKTCCEMTARLNLARAKYKAAVEALASVDKPSTEQAGS